MGMSRPADRLTALARSARLRVPRARGAYTPDVVGNAASIDHSGPDDYGGVVIGAGTIGELATDRGARDAAMDVLARLSPDPYTDYVRRFIARGEELGGDNWRYADIVTTLYAAATLIRPRAYLEIGVRRGRSMAIVASCAPDSAIIGIDMWQPDYSGMTNPGPAHVRREVEGLEFRGSLELISGDSHVELPRLFAERPDLSFDLVTVDGDHTVAGARRDLLDVLPRLRVGGVLVFDDIRHPAHPSLHDVWRRSVAANRRFASWEFDEVGYGVALAVRRW